MTRSRLKNLRSRFSLIAVGVLVLLAIVGPYITPSDPIEIGVGGFAEGPSWSHPFGTDQSGRDVFSRVLAGTRISVTIGLGSTALALFIGLVIGSFAALLPSWPGETMMRGLDVLLALPGVLMAIVLATTFGAGARTTVLALTVIYVPSFSRIVRSLVIGELQEDYVVSARLVGSSNVRLLTRHVFINIAGPVSVFAAVASSEAILLEGALSFIGVGVPPPSPSWGNVIADGRRLVLAGAWWVATFGGAAILVSVFVLTRFSEWLDRTVGGDAQ